MVLTFLYSLRWWQQLWYGSDGDNWSDGDHGSDGNEGSFMVMTVVVMMTVVVTMAVVMVETAVKVIIRDQDGKNSASDDGDDKW